MVMNECSACPRCGGRLKYYDSVPRLVRTKGRQTSRVPIFGVLEGLITCETLGFEDYPCEMTMLRWLSQKAQLLLWRNP